MVKKLHAKIFIFSCWLLSMIPNRQLTFSNLSKLQTTWRRAQDAIGKRIHLKRWDLNALRNDLMTPQM